MSIYELDISWAINPTALRRLHWGLIAEDGVNGVFLTTRDDVLAVLFNGDRGAFDALARTLTPDPYDATATTDEQGALT